ncbi:MAG: hypothetical protein ACYCOU_07530 [Sulfobacillus sp.]
MQIFYGIPGDWRDVTVETLSQWSREGRLSVPMDDAVRARYLGDHLVGTLKYLKIEADNRELLVPPDRAMDLSIDAPDLPVREGPREWYQKTGAQLENPGERLSGIHQRLYLCYGNCYDEYPEQLMAVSFVSRNSRVLELGGNVGRNSCVIASILDDDRNLVVLESCPESAHKLRVNRDLNGFRFSVEEAALSKVALIQKDWITVPSEIDLPGYHRVTTISYEQLKDRHPIAFDTLVCDCEGALYQILLDHPNFLDGFRTVVIENDFQEMSQKSFVDSEFLKVGLRLVYNQEGGFEPCYSCFYQVWQRV